MARKAQPFHLSDDEHRSLQTLLQRGITAARTQTRARVLDLLHRGQHPDAIAETLQVSTATVYNVKGRYRRDGFEAALYDQPRAGRPVEITGTQRARITALACSQARPLDAAPAGRQSRRTGAGRAHQPQCGPRDSPKNQLHPHLKKQWCIGTHNAEYLARMENVLHLYSLPHEVERPVICFDEQPVQLVGDVVAPLPPQAGQPLRYDYKYQRQGVASLLVAFEPLTSKRLVETSRQRTKADDCRFLQRVAATWPEAEKIVSVQDHLNTHNTSSFYENLPAAHAFALAQRFEMHYTPKKGSWLNIAELELSALSRICLGRRLASLKKLDDEIQALVKERNEQQCKVTWQFSIPQAREKLKRHYENVKPNN